MVSTEPPPDESEEPESRPSGAATPSDAEAYICRVCHESIPRTAEASRREALVHRACEAALRCGVSLGGSGQHRRHRERASW